MLVCNNGQPPINSHYDLPVTFAVIPCKTRAGYIILLFTGSDSNTNHKTNTNYRIMPMVTVIMIIVISQVVITITGLMITRATK